MKSFFEKDSVLKVFSFIIAIIIWLYILIVLDPSVDTTIKDIPIKYTQQNALTDQGLSIVDENRETVEIKVNGSRKRLVNINAENITATVDLSSVAQAGKHSLPIMLSVPYEHIEIIRKKPDNVEITVDRLVEEKRNISVRIIGSPEPGYIAGTVELNSSTVLLKGAASVVKQISDVYVSVDVSKRKTDLFTTAKIEFLDSDGRLLSSVSELFEYLSSDITETQLKCPIMMLKTISIKPNLDRKLQAGESVSVQPNTITVFGYKEDIENVEEVLTESVSLDVLKKDKKLSAQLLLPEKLKSRDNVNSVTVKYSSAQ